MVCFKNKKIFVISGIFFLASLFFLLSVFSVSDSYKKAKLVKEQIEKEFSDSTL